jgi:hypothetical protein
MLTRPRIAALAPGYGGASPNARPLSRWCGEAVRGRRDQGSGPGSTAAAGPGRSSMAPGRCHAAGVLGHAWPLGGLYIMGHDRDRRWSGECCEYPSFRREPFTTSPSPRPSRSGSLARREALARTASSTPAATWSAPNLPVRRGQKQPHRAMRCPIDKPFHISRAASAPRV